MGLLKMKRGFLIYIATGAYKKIFYLFNLCGLFINFETRSIRAHKNIRRLTILFLNIFLYAISVLQVLACIIFLIFSTSKSKKGQLIFVCIWIIFHLFRIFLSSCLLELKRIVKRLGRTFAKLDTKNNMPCWINFWMTTVLSIMTFMTIETIIMMYNESNIVKPLLFGYSIRNIYIKFFFSFSYALYNYLCLYMPLNVFDFYYAMVCLDISSLFNSFSEHIKTSSKRDYKQLTNLYHEIVSIAELLDQTVGFLMFVSFLYSAFLMYYGLICAYAFNNNANEHNYYIIVPASLLCFYSFIVKVESGYRIYTSSLLCKKESRKIHESNYRNVYEYERFAKNCKDISMTVWGFVGMNRNIILGTIGTILTYSLLFDNLIRF